MPASPRSGARAAMTDAPASAPPPAPEAAGGRGPARQLRLLIVASKDARHPSAGGGERLLELLGEELVQRGHAVRYWSAGAEGLPRQEVVHGVQVERRSRSRAFAPAVWARLLFTGRGRYDLVLEEIIGGERWPLLARLLARPPTMGAIFQDARPLFRALYGTGLRARAAGLSQELLLRAYRRGPLLTCSEVTRAWLVSRGVPSDRVAVVYPTVAGPRQTPPLQDWGQRKNDVVVIGNFRPTKRFEEAIQVIGRLRQEVPDARLHLVGRPYDPRYLAALQEKVRRGGLGGAVLFHLAASEEEKFALLASSKALTVHTPVEGFGWTLIEAGSVGVPVVAHPGVPAEGWTPGETGEQVPYGSVDGYVSVLARWMRTPQPWTDLSAGARRRAERFAGPVLTPALEAFLEGSARRTGGADPHR